METNKNQKNLKDRQLLAIPFILAAKSMKEAAEKADVSHVQLYEWLKDPEFTEELKRQRDLALHDAVNWLKCNVSKAAETLVCLLDSESENVRLKAANNILDHVAKFKELQELESRIEALENAR